MREKERETERGLKGSDRDGRGRERHRERGERGRVG